MSGGPITLIIANAAKNIAIVSVVTQVLLVLLGLLRMTNALSRKTEAARRSVLGDL